MSEEIETANAGPEAKGAGVDPAALALEKFAEFTCAAQLDFAPSEKSELAGMVHG